MSARIWDVAPMVALASSLMDAAVLVSGVRVVLPFLPLLSLLLLAHQPNKYIRNQGEQPLVTLSCKFL